MLEKVREWMKANPHWMYWLYFIYYLLHFFLLEHFSSPRYIIHCAYDDRIPFDDTWVIFYILWFPYFPGTLFYYMLKDKDDFKELAIKMFSGMTLCLWIYTFWPNGLDLRTGNYSSNIFGFLTYLIQSFDPPTSVCPSIHVGSTLCVMFFILGRKNVSALNKSVMVIAGILICLSTLFLKQHSLIDVFWGMIVAVFFELLFDLIKKYKNKGPSL